VGRSLLPLEGLVAVVRLVEVSYEQTVIPPLINSHICIPHLLTTLKELLETILDAVRKLVDEAGYRFDFSVRQGISPWPWETKHGPLKRLLIRGDDCPWDFHLNMTRGKSRL